MDAMLARALKGDRCPVIGLHVKKATRIVAAAILLVQLVPLGRLVASFVYRYDNMVRYFHWDYYAFSLALVLSFFAAAFLRRAVLYWPAMIYLPSTAILLVGYSLSRNFQFDTAYFFPLFRPRFHELVELNLMLLLALFYAYLFVVVVRDYRLLKYGNSQVTENSYANTTLQAEDLRDGEDAKKALGENEVQTV